MADKKEKDENVDQNQELDRQVERLGFFSHNSLSAHAQRINKIEALLLGLIEELAFRGLVDKNSMRSRAEFIEQETRNERRQLFAGVALRDDGYPPDERESLDVNCEERIHICKAACCKLSFALSIEEIESGKIKWDLGIPYHIRQDKTGYCVHLDQEKKCCSVYDDRPRVCKRYTCRNDGRIWKDFDKMILNEEWTSGNLKAQKMDIKGINLVPASK